MRIFHILAICLCILAPARVVAEPDEADRAVAAYYRSITDGLEHIVLWNGAVHDVSVNAMWGSVEFDPEKVAMVIDAGKPIIYYHSHPAGFDEDGIRYPPTPSNLDFAALAWFSYLTWKENPALPISHRIVMIEEHDALVISYALASSDITRTLNNAALAATYTKERATIQDNQEKFEANFMKEYEVEKNQKIAVKLHVLKTSMRVTGTPCVSSSEKISIYFICSSTDFNIWIQGVVE